MKEFRKPAKVEVESLDYAKRNSEGEFAFFTGTPKTNNRKASGRTAVLSLIPKGRPLPLASLAEKAAKAAGDKGFDYPFVRGGLALAGLAKPAVYFLLYKDEKGNFRAGVNIPNPDPTFSKRPYKKGDVVIPAKAEAKPEAKPALPAPVGGEG